ncbi:MAG: outer membrane homotrimeric porin [Mailhella sp.]|nr:outer membrane homotrimeric porin [Mailhella sp.]
MKKLVTLLAAAGMVASSVAPATAADVKLDGFYRYSFQTASTGFKGANTETVKQRMRLGLTITASENLSGYTQFQLGTNHWGSSPKHGDKDVQSRQYYIDWQVPGAPVKVRMGRQSLGLPADAFGGNNVLGSAWGPRDGIVVSTKAADFIDVTALWARQATDKDQNVDSGDSLDVFGLAANLKFDGFSVAPWVAYAVMGDGLAEVGTWDTDYNFAQDDHASRSYYFGGTATVTAFDPFKLVVSAAFGSREYNSSTYDDREGYSVEAKASYKLGFGTPVAAAWYASGDDKGEALGSGILPGINPYSSPTGTFFDNGTNLDIGADRYSTVGTWGVQLGVEDMSFLSGLTHAATVTYVQGTNDKANAAAGYAKYDNVYRYMTTEDSVVELALTSDYKIYKNLTACLELAYIISDFDEDLTAARAADTEDDWRAGLTFTYKF